MHVGSQLLEFALVSSLLLPLLQLVVQIILTLWRIGCSFEVSRKRSSVLGSNRKICANLSVTWRNGGESDI